MGLGEMGLGKLGLGELGLGEMGLGEMGQNPSQKLISLSLDMDVCIK